MNSILFGEIHDWDQWLLGRVAEVKELIGLSLPSVPKFHEIFGF